MKGVVAIGMLNLNVEVRRLLGLMLRYLLLWRYLLLRHLLLLLLLHLLLLIFPFIFFYHLLEGANCISLGRNRSRTGMTGSVTIIVTVIIMRSEGIEGVVGGTVGITARCLTKSKVYVKKVTAIVS